MSDGFSNIHRYTQQHKNTKYVGLVLTSTDLGALAQPIRSAQPVDATKDEHHRQQSVFDVWRVAVVMVCVYNFLICCCSLYLLQPIMVWSSFARTICMVLRMYFFACVFAYDALLNVSIIWCRLKRFIAMF